MSVGPSATREASSTGVGRPNPPRATHAVAISPAPTASVPTHNTSARATRQTRSRAADRLGLELLLPCAIVRLPSTRYAAGRWDHRRARQRPPEIYTEPKAAARSGARLGGFANGGRLADRTLPSH